MHFLLGQTAQGIGYVLVADLESVFNRHTLDHIREHRAGGNGAGAAKCFKGGIFDNALVADLEIEFESVATGQAAHLANGIGSFQGSHVVRAQKMVMNGFSVIPHNCLPKRSASLIL